MTANAASMSDAACAMVLIVSALIDMCGLFPTWLGDRLAFIGYLAAIAVGFQNSGLFETIRNFVDSVAAQPQGLWNVPLTRGIAQVGPQIFALLVLLVTFGAMVPARWSRWFGTFAQIQFSDFRPSGGSGGGSPVKGMPGAMSGGPRGMFRALFPGKVNLGMVAVAILFIVSASFSGFGLGRLMNSAINLDVTVASNLVSPLLGAIAPGVKS